MQRFYVNAQGQFIGSYDGPDAHNPYAAETLVPTLPGDVAARWNGTTWEMPAPDKPALKQLAADKRYRVETGGISVFGAPIKTDRESQGLITGAAALTKITGNSVKWKTEAGFVNVSAAQIEGIAVAVGNHVQAAFAAEEQIGALIDAGTITTPEQIETWGNWP